jgi:alkanesulfonate monooxygenase SsuD/methylene tetrahydromethanopterin reductase-like flavin-dependent oxidoreductase (luciferase family)
MNFGLLFPFRNPPQWRVPWPEFYAEHHLSEDGYSPSLIPIASAVAARTSSIRIGTFLILLPLHNAVRVAEDAATVDIISNGRFDLGFGQGYVPSEFEAYGISRKERGSRLQEGVEVIQGLFGQSPFSYQGKHYDLKEVTITPPPVQQPSPPIWIGARGPIGVKRTARLGCHWLGASDPRAQELYDNTLREEGRDPNDFHAAQLRWCFVGESTDKAWDACEKHLHYMLSWYGARLVEASDFRGDDAFARLPPVEELRESDQALLGQPMVGSPDEVAAEINAFTKGVRTTHLVLGMHLPGIDPAAVQRSMELFAKEVMPAIK